MNKIKGVFYPLQHEEWLRACRELTPSQKDVLYYIRTLDPYGDGIELSISEIGRQLSTESKKVHRSTISRALKALDEKGFVSLELIKVKIKVLGKGLHCCDETTLLSTDNSVVATQQARSPRNKRDRHATSAIATQQPEPETPTEQEFCDSKTYSDFIKTLSDAERENFLEFGKKKAAQLPKPPGLPLRWIKTHFEELAAQWRKTPGSVATSSKWESDPRCQEWLDKIRSLGFATFIYEDGNLDNERKEFYEWANANKLIWEPEP